MIETGNLRTASLYINNQLLSRGLLRDGQSIDFADPAAGDGDMQATMGRIMSVVNDLILRRDKDAEHRETLSTTLRSVRAENMRHVKDITTLTEKSAESKRKLELAESSEAALKTQLKSAEAAARGLKEEMIRTKALVSQARASCATEVRRRDRQIDSLKKQLGEAGRSRGARPNPAITTIHVTSELRSPKSSPVKSGSNPAQSYSLRDETNAFLANLAQNLSEENEAILGAMRRAMVQLREMSGFASEENSDGQAVRQPGWDEMSTELDSVLEHMKTILTNPSFVPIEEVMLREEEIARLKDGWVKMEDRWKDAVLLIDSWRKHMAASGKPVNEEEMMMSLRLSPAKTRDNEAAHYADFGLSAVVEEEEEEEEEERSTAQREDSPCPSNPDSLHLVPAETYDKQAADEMDSSAEIEEEALDESDAEEPNFEVLQESTAQPDLHDSLDSSPMPEPPQLSPLRNSNTAGNRGPVRNPSLRKLDFPPIAGEKKRGIAPPVELPKPSQASRQALAKTAAPADEKHRSASASSLDEVLLVKTSVDTGAREPEPTQPSTEEARELPSGLKQTPRRGPSSRLPMPRNAEPQQSPLTMSTIAAKLAASEKEADAARVRAKLRALRAARATQKPSREAPKEEPKEPEAVEGEKAAEAASVGPSKPELEVDAGKENEPQRGQGEEEQQLKPEKRKRDRRTSKAASRRRSTLSPLELQSLIAGGVQ